MCHLFPPSGSLAPSDSAMVAFSGSPSGAGAGVPVPKGRTADLALVVHHPKSSSAAKLHTPPGKVALRPTVVDHTSVDWPEGHDEHRLAFGFLQVLSLLAPLPSGMC